MSDNPNRVQYALTLLSSFEEIREKNIVCDFLIKAGDEEFHVHRAVLAASSEYFRSLLQSGMIEVKQGFINMKEMDAVTAKVVVTYMYTGEAQLSSELIENVLSAANLLLLDGLISMCWCFLQNSISVDNCVSIVQLSRRYDRCDVEADAERYLVENLGEVSSTSSFLLIRKNEIVHYISKSEASHVVLWEVMVSWLSHSQMKDRNELMVELVVAVMKIKNFPFQFLLEKTVTEELVRNSASVRNYILEEMFSKKEFESNLSHEIVFTLKEMVEESTITRKNEVITVIMHYILKNFEDLIKRKEFVHLNEHDMQLILQSTETKCSSEKLKWEAILKWTKHDGSREGFFKKFFKSLKLESLPHDFIRDEIGEEPIVKSSTECLQRIVNVSLREKKQESTESADAVMTNPSVAILDWKYSRLGRIRLFDVANCSFRNLGSSHGSNWICMDNCSIVNGGGVIYVMITEDFFRLDRKNKWIKLASLPQKAGEWPKLFALGSDVYLLAKGSNMARYHPPKNEWAVNLPSCGIDYGFCGLSFGNCLYAIGGQIGGKYTNKVRRFDPKSQKWSSVRPMMKKRSGASAAVLHGTTVVAGGYDGRKCLDSVECFAHLTRSWSTLANMNSCHMGFTLLNICDKLYACGGDFENSQGYTEEATVEVYDEENEKWMTMAKNNDMSEYFYACEFPF